MLVQDYGVPGPYCDRSAPYGGAYEREGERPGAFSENLRRSEENRCAGVERRPGKTGGNFASEEETVGEKADREEEELEEKLRRLDEELEQTRRRSKREQKRAQEERLRKKRIQKKIWEKLALKRYLARQDEIEQMNEKISLERAFGEDVYIEKPPLSKNLSVAELMAICSES